jgi:hypothetical protein
VARRFPLLTFFVAVWATFLVGCAGGGSYGSVPQSFSISVSPSQQTISPNTAAQMQLTLVPVGGFNGSVSVSLSGLPTGVTSTPASPFSLPASGLTLSLSAGPSAVNGTFALTFQATSGSLSSTVPSSLTVEPLASFNLTPLFSQLIVREGGTVSGDFDFTSGASGSANYSVNLSVTGLPAGVTASFSQNPLPGTNTQQTVTLTAAPNAVLAFNLRVQLVATRESDGAVASASFMLIDASPAGTLPGNRTTLIRTGDTPSSAVYDSLHQLVFASEPDLGLVDAVSIPGGQIVARIPVPGVEAVGLSGDNLKLLASSNLQQVAWIDTSLLRVLKWQVLPPVNDPSSGTQFWVPINPNSILPNFAGGVAIPTYTQNPYLLANGKVLFEALEGGFFPIVVEWDPIANTAVLRRELPTGGFVLANTAGTEVLFASNPCFYDAATDSVRNNTTLGGSLFAAGNPAGTQFALFKGPDILFIDNLFNVVGQVAISLDQQPTGMVYSFDGSRLYIVVAGLQPSITTIDTTNFSIVGTAPGYYYGDPQASSSVENPLAADDSGLIIGSAIGGLVFDDSTNLQALPQGIKAPQSTISPSEGSLLGGTVATIIGVDQSNVPDVWFGSQRATMETSSGVGQILATTASASAAGTVNVKIIQPTGVMTIIPQAFTFGSVPLLTAPLATAPGGKAVINLAGFGFSADSGSTSQQVSIGSETAQVLASNQAQGFPVQDLGVLVPAGLPGPADIVVKSSTGTATYPNGLRYLEDVTDFSSPDTFSAVLYDPARQQLYLNAGDHVDVFSLASKTFVSQIKPPSLGGTRQLQGMALTPDGTKLVIGNFSDDSVSIINPDAPSTATAVQIAPPIGPDAHPEGPHAVATTSLNTVFVDIGTTSDLTGGGGAIYELDLSTLKATLRTDAPGLQVAGEPMSQSADGSRVFVVVPDNTGGYVFEWSASTNAWINRNLGGLYSIFLNDVAATRDGSIFSVNNLNSLLVSSDFPVPMFLDQQLNQISQLGIESLFATVNMPGIALHDSGALLYSSTLFGVDLIDVRHGALAERIVLNEQASGLSGSLEVDESGARIFLVTNAGLTIVTMDAVPLSIGSVAPNSGIAGTSVTFRGSGITPSTAVKLNSTNCAVTFVDANTLQVTIPAAMNSGPVTINLTNPDGATYILDAAFSVN